MLKKKKERKVDVNLEIFGQSLEIKTTSLGIVVSVVFNIDPRILENGDVVSPSGVGDEDGLGFLVKFSQKFSSNPQSSSSRDGLARSDLE